MIKYKYSFLKTLNKRKKKNILIIINISKINIKYGT